MIIGGLKWPEDQVLPIGRTVQAMARQVSLIVLAVLITFLGITFFQLVAPFLLPLFLAGMAAVLCQPLFRRFMNTTGQRVHLAAGLTTGTVLAGIMAPLIALTVFASVQLISLAQHTLETQRWKEFVGTVRHEIDIDRAIEHYRRLTGADISPEDFQKQVHDQLKTAFTAVAQKTFGAAGSTFSLLGGMVSLVVGMLMFVIALHYFLADGPALLEGAQRLIPLNRDYQWQLLMQFDQVVRAVVLATFAAAIGQGLATGIGMLLIGAQHFFIITLIATLTALVPLLGTWLVWAPYAVWLAWCGHWAKAIFLVVYGAGFVGFLDNVIRTYVLNTNIKLHPLLAFVSVLGGLQVMGLWGVFIGPIVASCLYAMINIFNAELTAYSTERAAAPTTGEPPATAPPGPIAAQKTMAVASAIAADSAPPASNESTALKT